MLFRSRVPEISPLDVVKKQKSKEDFVLLDVREENEFNIAKISDPRVCLVPMTQLAREGVAAFPPVLNDNKQQVVVFCHLGSRSTQVVSWMKNNGWDNVLNMTGGIDAYSRFVNPDIRRY